MGIRRWGDSSREWILEKKDDGHFVFFTDHERVVAELTKAHQDNLDSWLHQREEIAFLRAELAAKSKDAARWEWLKARMLSADFKADDYVGLTFELPAGSRVSANADATIDAAMGEGNGR